MKSKVGTVVNTIILVDCKILHQSCAKSHS